MFKIVTAALAFAAALSACGAREPAPQPPVSSETSVPATTTPEMTTRSPVALPEPTVKPPPFPWSSNNRTCGNEIKVPSLPVLNRITTGAHPEAGYDRITFEFSGSVPSCEIKYVAKPIQDGSGNVVPLNGNHYLQIRFNPANAHFENGNTPPGLIREGEPNFAQLKAYVITGDYEAYVTVVMGLQDKAGFQVGELPGRTYSRLYIDVQR